MLKDKFMGIWRGKKLASVVLRREIDITQWANWIFSKTGDKHVEHILFIDILAVAILAPLTTIKKKTTACRFHLSKWHHLDQIPKLEPYTYYSKCSFYLPQRCSVNQSVRRNFSISDYHIESDTSALSLPQRKMR